MSTFAEELNQVDAVGAGQLALTTEGLYGPTFQGEGPTLGRYCFFLRLAGCNQHCVFCDVPSSWAFSDALAAQHRDGVKYDPKEEVHKSSPEDVVEALMAKMTPFEKPSMLVISGGEPMLQQRRLIPLLRTLTERAWRIEIETAGTIYPLAEFSLLVHQFNISPKLETSGNPLQLRYKPKVLEAFQESGRAAWKFVATSKDDLAEIAHIVHEHHLSPVYVMPEGITSDAIGDHMREIAEAVLEEGWNLSTRLQIEIWGAARGR